MLLKTISSILIWSEDCRRLADWYIEKLGLTPHEELNHPLDTGIGFMIGNIYFWIGQHSQVHGKNNDPCRHMIDFTVDSVTEAYKELKLKDVEFLATPFKAPTFDCYFATFYDLDGNLIQLEGGK